MAIVINGSGTVTGISVGGLPDDIVDAGMMADNSIDSDAYVDASIDNAHLADDAVGVAELSATGTASSSTFLRGDNSWATAGTTYAGIDDQSSSNDDQLTIQDGAILINDDGDDVDFRVESADRSHLFYCDAGNNVVGVSTLNGVEPQKGTFHILTTSAGAISPDTNADELVIETGTGGISIFSAVAGWGNIFFGDSDDDDIGKIQYNHNDNSISFTANAAKYLVIESSGVLSSEVPAGASKTNMNFRNGGVQKGSIVTSDYSNNTTYNTTSDYRLKENINYDWDATTRLKQLKPARFNFKANPDLTMDGFIAHEVSDVVSIAVTGEKDAMTTDDDGNAVIVPQGIDQSKLVPLLVKTIQELEARITILENP